MCFFTLFVFACVQWCPTHIVLCCCFVYLRLCYHFLWIVHFLIVPSVVANVYFYNNISLKFSFYSETYLNRTIVETVKLSKLLFQFNYQEEFLAQQLPCLYLLSINEFIIGTTSSVISDQLIEIYSIFRCSGILLHIKLED